jgi:uncharacterized coiled-coil DUF342 family protein
VRTAQRWQATLGLPIRRTHPERPKSAVIALRTEIDAWMKTLPLAADQAVITKSERDELLQTIAELRSENQQLRRKLEEASVSSPSRGC